MGSILIILKLKIASHVALYNLKFTEGLGGLLLSPISLVQFCIIFREKDYISSYPFIGIMAERTQASNNLVLVIRVWSGSSLGIAQAFFGHVIGGNP